MSISNPLYPLPSFCFRVETPDAPSGAFFRSVSGIRAEIEAVPLKVGGENYTTRTVRGAVKWSNLVLKRGYTANPVFTAWIYQWISMASPKRVSLVVTQLDTQMRTARAWTFINAWPVKWEISELDATKSEISIETIELSHQGMV